MDYPNEEQELRQRFYQQKLDDFINDNIKAMPTMILEEEDPKFIKLIQPFVLFGNMKPFTSRCISPPTEERLETKKIKDYGELYALIIPN